MTSHPAFACVVVAIFVVRFFDPAAPKIRAPKVGARPNQTDVRTIEAQSMERVQASERTDESDTANRAPRRVRKNAARPLNRSVSRCDGPDDLEAGQSMTRQATPRLASPPVRPPAAPSKSDSRLDRRDLSSVYREIAVQYCVDSPDHAWIHHSLVNEHEQQSLATPRSCLAKMPSTKPSIVLRSGSSSMETSTNNSSAATATKRCPRATSP